MTNNQLNKKNRTWNGIIISLSIIGLIACIAVLFPQVRRMILDLGVQIVHRGTSFYPAWFKALLSYAMGGICFILFFDYCTLTKSGRKHVERVKQEMKDCISEIDFRSFLKPSLVMVGVYLLGILTIIRANFSYNDDIGRSIAGFRGWYEASRYVSEFASIFVHAGTRLTDISPLPQLIAILILAISSVLLVYIMGNKKITVIGLLASIPLGLSPYSLECLSYKFDAPYMALSILVSIVPFLFFARKGAFLFVSVLSLLIMCTTYQISSGIYLVIVVILCFRDWNNQKKTNKEILSFLGIATVAYCFAILLFKIFLMKPRHSYGESDTYPFSQLVSGSLLNIKNYFMIINQDWSTIWKIGVVLVLLFFIAKSINSSAHKKILSLFVSLIIIGLSFILSNGILLVFKNPLPLPRYLYEFGVFLAIVCIYVVLDYKKIASVAVLALNWCFFTFAFSYGNALADQARYAEFRIGTMLHDLSALYPAAGRDDLSIQLKNSIDYAPSVKNIAKHYPVIEKLVPKRLVEGDCWDALYYLDYFNYMHYNKANLRYENYVDYSTLNLPVVLDSYYHVIQSDGEHVLVVLKH